MESPRSKRLPPLHEKTFIKSDQTTQHNQREEIAVDHVGVRELKRFSSESVIEAFVSQKRSQHEGLSELETTLEEAEVKCDTLRKRIHHIKEQYQDKLEREIYSHDEKVFPPCWKELKSTQFYANLDKLNGRQLLKTIEEVSYCSPPEREQDGYVASSDADSLDVPAKASSSGSCSHIHEDDIEGESLPQNLDGMNVTADERQQDSSSSSVTKENPVESTEETRPAKVIQDILGGITETVNRLSQLQAKSPRKEYKRHRHHHHHHQKSCKSNKSNSVSGIPFPTEAGEGEAPLPSEEIRRRRHRLRHQFRKLHGAEGSMSIVTANSESNESGEMERKKKSKHRRRGSRAVKDSGAECRGVREAAEKPMSNDADERPPLVPDTDSKERLREFLNKHFGQFPKERSEAQSRALSPERLEAPAQDQVQAQASQENGSAHPYGSTKVNMLREETFRSLPVKREKFAKIKQQKSKESTTKVSLQSKEADKGKEVVELYHNKMLRPGSGALRRRRTRIMCYSTVRPCTVPHRAKAEGEGEAKAKAERPTPSFASPTVASKMKQVDKACLQRLNFCNIPFVVGTSTSPSHNLGLNIQQALSIIKMRHMMPEARGCEAGAVPSAISCSTMRSGARPSTAASLRAPHRAPCPLTGVRGSRSETPERDVDSLLAPVGPESDPPPGTFASLLQAQGNVGGLPFPQERQRPEGAWDLDPDAPPKEAVSGLRCTCQPPRSCVDYHKVLSDYLEHSEGTVFHMLLPSASCKSVKSGSLSSRGLFSKSRTSGISRVASGLSGNHLPKERSLQRYSKNLNAIIMNMHEEFLRLNVRYERLQNEANKAGTDEIALAKELAKMESELQTKEDEITFVMGLYKEMGSLREQVRSLRERAAPEAGLSRGGSACTRPARGPRPPRPQLQQREPTIAVRLTRLLRSIQQFQERLLHD